jgi:hypothetical protein
MTKTVTLDRPPPDWFVVEIMRRQSRAADWVALMIDVPPDEYAQGRPSTQRGVFVRIPGKHRNRDHAWNALGRLDGYTALTNTAPGRQPLARRLSPVVSQFEFCPLQIR